MFKVNNRSTRHHSGVFIVHSEYAMLNIFDILFQLFLLTLNLMHFSVKSRCPVTYNTKLYITTVNNNSFLSLTILSQRAPF